MERMTLLVRVLLVAAVTAVVVTAATARRHGERPLLRRRLQPRRQQQHRGLPNRNAISNNNNNNIPHPQQQQPLLLASITELRWINADTNRRIRIDGSSVVPLQTLEEFADTIDGDALPKNAELSMEAVVDTTTGGGGGAAAGTVGSILFTFNGVTYIDNQAPFLVCGNRGTDYWPCPGLRQDGGRVTAQVFSGPNATGTASPQILLTYIRYYVNKAAPLGSFRLVNADSDDELDFLDNDNATIVNITQTPNVAVFIDAWSARSRWGAESARITYNNNNDNGQQQRIVVVVENQQPLVFPGNHGPDYFGFTPSVGRHSISATLHSQKHLMGRNTTWGPVAFTVVE
jgi:hypothetical protein